MYTITTNAAAEMPATMTSELDMLIAALEAPMQPYESAFALDDDDTMEDAGDAIAEA